MKGGVETGLYRLAIIANAAKPITNDQKRGIRQHSWAVDSRHVLFTQDNDGDENFHVYAVDIVSGTQKDLTPYPGVRAEIVDLSWKRPGVVAVGLNDREPEWHDLYEIDIATGQRTLIEKNTDTPRLAIVQVAAPDSPLSCVNVAAIRHPVQQYCSRRGGSSSPPHAKSGLGSGRPQ